MSEQPYGKGYGNDPARNYERYFVPAIGAPVAADFVAMADLSPDDRVLDVGCGTGIVTRLAAERAAKVTGVDINPAMLEVARETAPAGAAIDWHQSSAESLPLPDEGYDVVLCQMSMQFFPDKAAAVKEMKRVLVPGGRLALNVPGSMSQAFEVIDAAIGRHLGPEASGFVQAVFSLHEADELRGLLAGEGFADVNVTTKTVALTVPAPREFLWQYVHSTPIMVAASQADDEHLAALEREVVKGCEPFVRDGGMTIAQEVLVATARKPSS